MARVLIAGCGDLGAVLGSRLVRAGHVVWGLRRQPGHLPPVLRPLQADLQRPEDLAVLPRAHCAAVPVSGFSTTVYISSCVLYAPASQ